MCKNDVLLTNHAAERGMERLCMPANEVNREFRIALQYGNRFYDFKDCKSFKYIRSKTNASAEAVVYNGVCYIISKYDGSCVTLYKLHNEVRNKNSYNGKIRIKNPRKYAKLNNYYKDKEYACA